MAADFRETGFGVIYDFLTPDEVQDARHRVESLYAAEPQPHRPKGDVVINHLQSKDPWFIGLLDKPVLEGVLSNLLKDPNSRNLPNQPDYIVGEYIARSSSPRGLGLHVDAWMPAVGEVASMVQLIVALEERTTAEGCTIVVPGSHLSGQTPYFRKFQTDVPAVTPVELQAGNAILVDSRLWHGATARTSAKMGWAVVITFQRWWVRQRYDIPATLSSELKRQLTIRQLALLGCYAGAPVDEFSKGYDGGYRKLYDGG